MIFVETRTKTVFVGAEGREYDSEAAARHSLLRDEVSEWLHRAGGYSYDFNALDAADALIRAIPEDALDAFMRNIRGRA